MKNKESCSANLHPTNCGMHEDISGCLDCGNFIKGTKYPTIKRYHIDGFDHATCEISKFNEIEHPQGEWVKFTDIKKLLKKLKDNP